MSVEDAVRVTGNVTSIDSSGGKYTVTIANVETVCGTGVEAYEKLLVYIKPGGYNLNGNDAVLENLKIGNTVWIEGKAEAFMMPGNPGQFNSYRYYREQEYAYMIYADKCVITGSSVSYREYLRKVSDYLTGMYGNYLPENEAAIVSAMLFGRKSLLDEDDREMYRVNGLMHVLAVSGMHVGTISMILLWVISRMPVGFRTGRVSVCALILMYGTMTGFSVSCIRAVIMLIIKITAELTGREYDNLSSVSFAAVVTLAINPRSLFHCDFILSYLAVTAITVVYPYMEKIVSGDILENPGKINCKYIITGILVKSVLPGVCTTVVTMPAVLYYYYEMPVYSALINVIILPCISIVFMMACLCAVTGNVIPVLTSFSAGSIHYILSMYRVICRWCMDNVSDFRVTGFPGAAKTAICCIAAGIILYAMGKVKRHISKRMLCILFLVVPVGIMCCRDFGSLKITFMDVGQGDGIVMSLPDGRTVCIDGGSLDVSGLAKYRIEPYLSYMGIKHIDYWVITHMDSDHYSGFSDIVSRSRYNGIRIDNIVLPDTKVCRAEYEEWFKTYGGCIEGSNVEFADSGKKLVLGDVVMRFANPAPEEQYGCYTGQNESSIVIDMSYGNFDVLFAGDVEGAAEDNLYIDGGRKYEILKVAHHGSKNSSSQEILEQIRPDNAVISCGRNNRFGHPHKETLDRLESVGARTFCTYECGAVMVSVRENRMEFEQFL